jgi:adenylyltransferase/sulfurtransferase
MRKILIFIGLLSVGLSGCMRSGMSSGHLASVTPSELMQRLAAHDNLVLVDVRQPEELQGPLGALPGAVNIPLPDLPDRFQEIPQDKDVVLICRTGNRSAQAYAFLARHGYTRLYNLTGGMTAMRQQKAR